MTERALVEAAAAFAAGRPMVLVDTEGGPVLYMAEAGHEIFNDDGEYVVDPLPFSTWQHMVLPTLKAQLCREVDLGAERERLKYITPGSGQALEYQQASAEADRLLAALEQNPELVPDQGDYPMLAASLGIDGSTLAEVAGTVAGMQAQWHAIGAAIRAARLTAKAAINAAATEEAATAAAAVVWPQPPA